MSGKYVPGSIAKLFVSINPEERSKNPDESEERSKNSRKRKKVHSCSNEESTILKSPVIDDSGIKKIKKDIVTNPVPEIKDDVKAIKKGSGNMPFEKQIKLEMFDDSRKAKKGRIRSKKQELQKLSSVSDLKPPDNDTNYEIQLDDSEKLSRTLFVGNLPAGFSKKHMKSLFSKYGKVESMRFRNAVPGKPSLTKKVAVITKTLHPERETLNAYVVLKKGESAVQALELNGIAIDGNHIRVDLANNKDYDHQRSVFVGNLPFGLADDELWTFFNDCGTVESVRIIRDKETGAGKGFGYVLFASESSVQVALKKHDQEFANRSIRVFRVKKEKIKHAARRNNSINKGPKENHALQRKNNKQNTKNIGGKNSFEGVRSEENVKERVKIQRNIKSSTINKSKKPKNKSQK